ncbi:hypothetical protein ISF_09217 [Cordyceps fumosorosea ARSEF 2679]|uniref:Uncharacterized protein n=1 Tax=Cordyceps fumosorosea (strain ARSEF 2679) TaxID=1081104 RepID=A0A167LCV2_CORFA|nr:hypothetical protein ISF_09217 [Cordyceps fumosorosea ARSEF 2679]OAA52939.1 hypothetical protein ISF_09217 [Cordyceps fumosorosea ARSEF 2679]
MAEITTLVAAIYRGYTTAVEPRSEQLGPVITSRFELFYDEGKQHMKEHDCWVRFRKQE